MKPVLQEFSWKRMSDAADLRIRRADFDHAIQIAVPAGFVHASVSKAGPEFRVGHLDALVRMSD
ncbi:MAG: hypothetical protein ACKO2P_14570 [Planctomycetota bacterium]